MVPAKKDNRKLTGLSKTNKRGATSGVSRKSQLSTLLNNFVSSRNERQKGLATKIMKTCLSGEKGTLFIINDAIGPRSTEHLSKNLNIGY